MKTSSERRSFRKHFVAPKPLLPHQGALVVGPRWASGGAEHHGTGVPGVGSFTVQGALVIQEVHRDIVQRLQLETRRRLAEIMLGCATLPDRLC